jgi:hypothetical protein
MSSPSSTRSTTLRKRPAVDALAYLA